MLEFVAEGLPFLAVGEVAVLLAPECDPIDHAIDHALERVLALRGTELAAEVLLRHDIAGVQGPVAGELDAFLLEDDRAVEMVDDAGVPPLPVDLVVWVDTGLGEVPLQPDSRR